MYLRILFLCALGCNPHVSQAPRATKTTLSLTWTTLEVSRASSAAMEQVTGVMRYQQSCWKNGRNLWLIMQRKVSMPRIFSDLSKHLAYVSYESCLSYATYDSYKSHHFDMSYVFLVNLWLAMQAKTTTPEKSF